MLAEQDETGGSAMSGRETELLIERQLTLLLRRVQHMHAMAAPDGAEVDRSGYGILSRIADAGPQRLSALAVTFGLDPSTITRQVQALEASGLLRRTPDPRDRRASLLELTDAGHDLLASLRHRRIEALRGAMATWSPDEQHTFGRLLQDFNDAVGRTVVTGNGTNGNGVDGVSGPDGADGPDGAMAGRTSPA